MKIAVLKETAAGETRCRRDPGNGQEIRRAWRRSRGRARAPAHGASITDADFEAAGATARQPRRGAQGRRHHPVRQRARAGDADRARTPARCWSVRSIRAARGDAIEGYAAAGLEALAMEWMPRITRAQSMDILSSQSNLAGYKAVVDAAGGLWPRLPDDDDRGGDDQPGQIVRHGGRRRRPAGDRHRTAARRAGQRDRRPLGDAGSRSSRSGAKPIFVENVAGIEGEGAGGYATEMSRRISSGAGRTGVEPHRQAGHRHHHRADPRHAARRG